ncbi:dephospho-CoA kinase [Coxiella endosymbiont of Amblyomma americanum]|uniref:dephospho-CoA kinase n=1 Tax=Coxiella endosymbiont of Amblyomma americanum TaxID=325775 RepID=UPI00057EE44C|nr:dephospho-CoA kinase [Coxiella endosymbiont of Amblyomma americanum]AJC50402.1 dephospho-CoA kinase [Coxiella endosymbiont of Amblyomma americanum]AUJ58745.1 dephospho-CoA kinase [Coxiella-like endosymbiont of Amblyomma americanum]
MLRIGLTGGIGSGKSTVAYYFTMLGVPIADADEIAREITISNKIVFRKIKTHFGKEILNEENSIDRPKLRRLIFKYSKKRRWLEHLLHPIIISVLKTKIRKINAPYCVLVMPLLTETFHSINFLDRILVVDAPLSLQIQRIKMRNRFSDNQIRLILKSQSNSTERLSIADDIIVNDKTFSILWKMVFRLHCLYLKLAKKHFPSLNNSI